MVEAKTPRSALRITSPAALRRFTGRLLNQLRNSEITNESAAVQIKIAELMLKAILVQSPADAEAAEIEEI